MTIVNRNIVCEISPCPAEPERMPRRSCAQSTVSQRIFPDTRLAADRGPKGMANMVIAGRLFKETEFCSEEAFLDGVRKSIPARKQELLDSNMAAVKIGMKSGE